MKPRPMDPPNRVVNGKNKFIVSSKITEIQLRKILTSSPYSDRVIGKFTSCHACVACLRAAAGARALVSSKLRPSLIALQSRECRTSNEET